MDIEIISLVILIGGHQVWIKCVGTPVFARKAYLYGVEDAIEAAPGLHMEYFEIVDGNTLQKISNWEDTSYVVGCITVFCGEVRLIDNIKYKE